MQNTLTQHVSFACKFNRPVPAFVANSAHECRCMSDKDNSQQQHAHDCRKLAASKSSKQHTEEHIHQKALYACIEQYQ